MLLFCFSQLVYLATAFLWCPSRGATQTASFFARLDLVRPGRCCLCCCHSSFSFTSPLPLHLLLLLFFAFTCNIISLFVVASCCVVIGLLPLSHSTNPSPSLLLCFSHFSRTNLNDFNAPLEWISLASDATSSLALVLLHAFFCACHINF